MSVYAVIPVKALTNSKRRLSQVLSLQERKQLTLAMLKDVLSAAKKSKVDKTLVIGNDLELQDVASEFGASYLTQKSSGLNSAIKEATSWCVQSGAKAVLILPADIPLLSPLDVNRMIELKENSGEKSMVLSPSYNGGTNALLLYPPDGIPACFGAGSFRKHVEQANQKNLRQKYYCSLGVIMDIDSAPDLHKLLKIEAKTFSHVFLENSRLNSNPNPN
jgi:2-phospho-L-lactate/phosphoenolpyruvate guanylyltransferase